MGHEFKVFLNVNERSEETYIGRDDEYFWKKC